MDTSLLITAMNVLDAQMDVKAARAMINAQNV